MSSYLRTARFISQQPWAIRESTMDIMMDLLRMRQSGITLTKEEVQARLGAAAARPPAVAGAAVAILPLEGVIAPKMNMFMEISGGTSLELFLKQFRQFRDDPAVAAIVVPVESPGGSVFGLREAFDEIYASRDVKPMVAVVHYQCASAALFLASAFPRIVCSPSGEIGSIGTLMVHEDWSKANEMMGMKPTYITYGKYKGEGNVDTPLSEETLQYYTEQAAIWGQDFEKAVAKGRGVSLATVRKDFGQARMLLAKEALEVGLVDEIATFDAVVAKLAGRGRSGGARAVETVPPLTATADDSRCGACHGSGLAPERFMSDPQGQLPCEVCGGSGTTPAPAPAEAPAADDVAATRDAVALALDV